MKFEGFEWFVDGEFTRTISASERCFDLHNDWIFVGFSWSITRSSATLEWVRTDDPSHCCELLFEGVSNIEITPTQGSCSLEDSQNLANILYQNLENVPPFVSFWFGDGKLIRITANVLKFIEMHR